MCVLAPKSGNTIAIPVVRLPTFLFMSTQHIFKKKTTKLTDITNAEIKKGMFYI